MYVKLLYRLIFIETLTYFCTIYYIFKNYRMPKLDGKFVKSQVEKERYTLLSTYTKSMDKMTMVCAGENETGEHHFCEITWANFRCGHRCRECGFFRRKQTCRKKYGVDSPQQSEEVKEKIRNASRERYGVDHYLNLKRSKRK